MDSRMYNAEERISDPENKITNYPIKTADRKPNWGEKNESNIKDL